MVEKIIELYSANNKLLAIQKTTINNDGVIEHKFENPKTGHWVKYSTWAKNTSLSEEEKYLVKTFYVHKAYECVFQKHNHLKAILFESGKNVLLGPKDELVKVLYRGNYFDIFVVKREERLAIEVDGYISDYQELENALKETFKQKEVK